ncbi:hypothetical protein AK830_g6806 [Neonectria ditissima]|uniref:mitogen-activated protein kinase n=1 Tax=Neonectria ditissima TaxID=78410 RepID=A0A0P7AYX2_9HYPO|nr:hypothetical protein AK830_g6806 [Neonectria ditissima]
MWRLRQEPMLYLFPGNNGSREVLQDPRNKGIVEDCSDAFLRQQWSSKTCIPVPIPDPSSRSFKFTILTMGPDGDIKINCIPGLEMGCSLLLRPLTGQIILHDFYPGNRLFLRGPTASSFTGDASPRFALLNQTTNLKFSFGLGLGSPDSYVWHVVWRRSLPLWQNWTARPRLSNERLFFPGCAALSSIVLDIGETKIMRKRCIEDGPTSTVLEGILMSSGDIVAVKEIELSRQVYQYPKGLKSTIKKVSSLSHLHLVRFIGAATGPKHLYIMEPLKSGNITQLDNGIGKAAGRVRSILYQTLQALDYLDRQGFVHGEVRPENIMYTQLGNGSYLYQLSTTSFAEFNRKKQDPTYADWFKAPEVLRDPKAARTSKADIWSLYATLLFTFDRCMFRKLCGPGGWLRMSYSPQRLVYERYHCLHDMVNFSPEDRPTAATILDQIPRDEYAVPPCSELS